MSYGSNVNMKEVCATNNPQNSDVNVIQHNQCINKEMMVNHLSSFVLLI
jgi:hypothetical protein